MVEVSSNLPGRFTQAPRLLRESAAHFAAGLGGVEGPERRESDGAAHANLLRDARHDLLPHLLRVRPDWRSQAAKHAGWKLNFPNRPK